MANNNIGGKKPKRVLQVLGAMHRAGAETMIMNLYRNIDRDTVQFDFLLKDSVQNGYEEEIRALGGRIFCVESAKKSGPLKYIMNQRKVMKENGPYVAVHSHMNNFSGVVMLSAYLAGIKNRIAHSHNTHFPYGRITQAIFRWMILAFSTKRIACGEDAGKALFGNHGFTVLPNGIDVEKYLPISLSERNILREKLSMDCDKIQICHIGRFEKVKNHKFILEIAQKLKEDGVNFQIHLLGSGDMFDEILQEVRRRNLTEIVLHGNVDNVNEYLRATDFLILPSLYEGLPVTLVEGQCAGARCLVSDSVTHEVDFNLGLMNYLPLEVKAWADMISIPKERWKTISKDRIREMVRSRGYSVKDNVVKLMELYEI